MSTGEMNINPKKLPVEQLLEKYQRLQTLVVLVTPLVEAKYKRALKNKRPAKKSWWQEFHGIFATQAEELLRKLQQIAQEHTTVTVQLDQLDEHVSKTKTLLEETKPYVMHSIHKGPDGVPRPNCKAVGILLELEKELA